MLVQTHAPTYLVPEELDDYLERGWFRMGQNIFTTNFVHFHQQIYSTIWLKIILDKFTHDPAQARIFKRNTVFRTEIKPATITPEKEELYQRYRESISFQPSASIQQLLFGGNTTSSIYNTYEVSVSDGHRLIAVGYFDIGNTSAMGISSIYDPAYKKYSLGKYLIYQKIEYCKKLGLRYFYPGYFVPGYSLFDYKLTIGRSALEFLQLSSQQWLPINIFSSNNIPFDVMQTKLKTVQELLAHVHLDASIIKYEYFDAGLIPNLKNSELFDFPIMLMSPSHSTDGINPVLVYDVRDEHYHLKMCVPVWKPENIDIDPNFYSTYILKEIQTIYATTEANEIAEAFMKVLKL